MTTTNETRKEGSADFWQFIKDLDWVGKCRAAQNGYGDYEGILSQNKEKYPAADLCRWWVEAADLTFQLVRRENACEVDFDDFVSDDGLEYLCSWVVAHGKEAYLEALDNPNKLKDYWGKNDYEAIAGEGLLYCIGEVADENETPPEPPDYPQ